MADVWIRATRLVGADLDPGARRPGHRRARLRGRRARTRAGRCDAGHPDPRVRRAHPVAPDALRGGPAGARARELAASVHDAVVRGEPRRFVIGVQWGSSASRRCYAAATLLVEPVRTYITTRALGISALEVLRGRSPVSRRRRADGGVCSSPARRSVAARRTGRRAARSSSSWSAPSTSHAASGARPRSRRRSGCARRRRRRRSSPTRSMLRSSGLTDRLGRPNELFQRL